MVCSGCFQEKIVYVIYVRCAYSLELGVHLFFCFFNLTLIFFFFFFFQAEDGIRDLYVTVVQTCALPICIGALSRVAHAVAKPLVWANWRGLESLLKVQLKLGKCDMVPKERIEDGVNCSVPIATPGFFPMVADGRIKAIRGSFERYDGNSIVMTGGQRVQADVAVLAIGYKLGVPFLPEAYRQKLVDADGQYRLYRLIANPDLPELGFVGFNSSFCTVLCADLAARSEEHTSELQSRRDLVCRLLLEKKKY